MSTGRSRPIDRAAGTGTGFGGAPAGQTAAAFAPGGYYNPLPVPQAQPVGIPYAPQPDNTGVNSGGTNPGGYTQPINYNLPPQAGSFISALLGQGGMNTLDPGSYMVSPPEPPWLGHTKPAMPTPEQFALIIANLKNKGLFSAPFQNPQNGIVGGGGGGPFTHGMLSRAGYTGPSPFQAQPMPQVGQLDPRRLWQNLVGAVPMTGWAGSQANPAQLMAARQAYQAQAPAGSARGGYQPTY